MFLPWTYEESDVAFQLAKERILKAWSLHGVRASVLPLTYIPLEPNWPLFLKVNPPKEGPFHSKQGSFGFQAFITFGDIYEVYVVFSHRLTADSSAPIVSHSPGACHWCGACWHGQWFGKIFRSGQQLDVWKVGPKVVHAFGNLSALQPWCFQVGTSWGTKKIWIKSPAVGL